MEADLRIHGIRLITTNVVLVLGFLCRVYAPTPRNQNQVIHNVSLNLHKPNYGRHLQQSTGETSDKEALLRFKAQITGDPRGVLSTWKEGSDEDPCSWYGVTCASSLRRVVDIKLQNADLEGDVVLNSLLDGLDKLELLDLSGNQLHFPNLSVGESCASLQTLILAGNRIHAAEIPPDLFLTCRTLEVVNLAHTNLTSSLPSTLFTGCGSLQLLDLSYNNLKGNLPYGISQCSSLEELRLSSNLFSGQLPLDIITDCVQVEDGICNGPHASRTNLQLLDLSLNRLLGPIVGTIFSQCQSLVSIDLSSNAFTGAIPVSLEGCSELQYLNLSNNKLGNSIPASLGNLNSIKTLDLSNNTFTGAIPEELAYACPTLIKLDLSVNNVTGSLPSSFSSCKSLQHLNLASNNLSGPFPTDVIVSLESLQNLILTFNGFTGRIPSDICSGSPPLKKLMLPNNGFTGQIPTSLFNCSELNLLDLTFNHLKGEIPPEIGRLSNLESLSMWYNQFTGEIPKEIGMLSKLRVLILNNNLLSGSLPDELANCTQLQWLMLSNNQLNGSIPASFGTLQKLTMLEMGNNSMSGPIPPEIANASSFLWVDLNSNFLSGNIPSGIGRHSNGPVDRLHGQVFTFIRNYLGTGCRGSGTLLEFAGITQEALRPTPLMNSCNSSRVYGWDSLNDDPDLSTIQVLDLSYNRLEGSIPGDMGYLSALVVLSLGNNMLEGTIPATFTHLRTVGILDLSHNKLHGTLSPLANWTFLVEIDVSYNNFSGEIPQTGQLSIAPAAGFQHNPGLCGEPLRSCHMSDFGNGVSEECVRRSSADSVCINNRNRFTVLPWANSIVMGIIIAVALLCMLIVWGVIVRAKKRQKDTDEMLTNLQMASCQRNSSWNLGGEREPLSINVATFERPLRKLTFAQLIEATNGFSQESLVGIGGFGEVYRAELKDGSTVAIKKLLHFSYQGDREFTAEMETLGKIKHRNLVPLVGYCKVGEERLLVYEYMHGGSLDDRLHTDDGTREKLTWELRKQIACGAARGLCFLHHFCRPHIIHRDMKSSNVLLDRSLEARVSDFGMARLISALDTHLSVSTLAGTPGYVPPEYYQSFRCTFKGDIYSFGVILLELLTGKKPTDKEFFEDTNLVGWVRQIVSERRPADCLDPRLQSDPSSQYEMLQYLQIACDCVQDIPSRRPTMLQIVSMLKAVTAS
ncbi:hypothetical protein KP509_04G066800 [Ceratopteris richardii]|uniref:non-specific serine/threonine protein kinase n=1 Tax=Ceratopteris richardii TaxID=49495 RepID=A0A8T2V029_CERRI|nr:hypothetical protein KP509_04G066800 [Ceratopteris richardii]